MYFEKYLHKIVSCHQKFEKMLDDFLRDMQFFSEFPTTMFSKHKICSVISVIREFNNETFIWRFRSFFIIRTFFDVWIVFFFQVFKAFSHTFYIQKYWTTILLSKAIMKHVFCVPKFCINFFGNNFWVDRS